LESKGGKKKEGEQKSEPWRGDTTQLGRDKLPPMPEVPKNRKGGGWWVKRGGGGTICTGTSREKEVKKKPESNHMGAKKGNNKETIKATITES